MRKVLFSVLLLLLGSSAVLGAEKVRLITEDFPPFGFVENDALRGIGPEIVDRLRHSPHVAATDIEVLPWKRGYQAALSEPNTALFSMHRIPLREKLFKWVGPLYSMQNYLFGKSDYPKTLETLEDAKLGGLILVQAGGASETRLSALGFTNLLPMNNPERQLKMLLIGRAALYYTTDIAITHQLTRLDKPVSLVKPALKLEKSDFYLAFSPATPDRVVNAWQQALDELKASGELARIQAKYALQDPQG